MSRGQFALFLCVENSVFTNIKKKILKRIPSVRIIHVDHYNWALFVRFIERAVVT